MATHTSTTSDLQQTILSDKATSETSVYTKVITIKKSFGTMFTSQWSLCEHATVVYIFFLTLLLMATPIAVGVVLRFYNNVTYLRENHCKRGYVHQITATLTLSTGMYCWMGFVTLYVLHYKILNDFEHYQLTRSNALPELYLPCSAPGYYMLYAIGGIFLLEFPFLVYYINKHTTNTRCGTNRKNSKCLSRGCNIIKSAGWTGMVYYQQILTGYFVYYLMLLIASPVYAIAYCAAYISYTILVIATLSLLTHCCVHGRRVQSKGCCFLFFAIPAALNLTFASSILVAIAKDNIRTSFDGSHIISTAFSSLLIAVLVYFGRKIFLHTTHVHHQEHDHHHDNTFSCQNNTGRMNDEEMIAL